MAIKGTYLEFRKLLRTAIGDRTQAKFAQEAGLSPEYLSRVLNNEVISRPTRSTVAKISATAANHVTHEALLKSLEYSTPFLWEEPDDDRKIKTAKKKAMEIYNGLIDGVHTHASSIKDFVDFVASIYGGGQLVYDICDFNSFETDYEEKEVVFSFLDDGNNNLSFEVCFFITYEYEEKGVFILDVECVEGDDGKRDKPVMRIVRSDEKSRMDHIYRRNFSEMRRETAEFLAQQNGSTPAWEELSIVLRDNQVNVHERPYVVEGIGFYYDKVDEYKIREFINNHREAMFNTNDITKKAALAKMYHDMVETDMPLEETLDGMQKIMETGGDNIGTLLAWIISNETDIKLECMSDRRRVYPWDNRPSVMYTKKYAWEIASETERYLKPETLMVLIDDYAVELGTKAESTYFVMSMPER